MLQELDLWLQEIGLTSGVRVKVRTDGAPSVVSIAKEFASRRRAETILETSPTKSSSSMGIGEKSIQLLEGQIRALLLELKEYMGVELTASHAAFGWLVRHANYLLNRFQPLKQHKGKTSYEVIQG